MNRCFISCLTAGVVLIFSLRSPAEGVTQGGTISRPRIVVRVYNYAHVSDATLREAKREASTIFREAGVDTQWVDCPLILAEAKNYAACQQLFGLAVLTLRIVPRSMVEQDVPTTALGFALQGFDGKPGRIANVFFHRVEETANAGQAFRFHILGNVMAHEVGHLLLGTNCHSPTGIMKAKWNRQEMQPASQGLLGFTPKESTLMRENVLSRIMQQQAIQASALPSSE